jgi:YgiT-type zinc finger domain-containing protein
MNLKEKIMVTTYPKETFVPKKVTYTIDIGGKLLVIEHVPARVCLETGEQLFSAETVERIQQLILNKQKPTRVMEVPVFEFA